MSKIKQFKCKNTTNTNNIKYQVRFGIQLNNNEDESGVFAKPEYYVSIEKAKIEVITTFNEIIKAMFPDATHDGLIMVKDVKCDCGSKVSSVKYSNGGQELFGRMDGLLGNGQGEFFIDIVEAQQS